ncbi:hypothetical protein HKX48_009035 [Thoreauomyces humboldtii]|nr:hypothetical protein HKX48_009035 [Thoreauomyces humboldtii]
MSSLRPYDHARATADSEASIAPNRRRRFPAWYITWSGRRQHYLAPFTQPIPWLCSERLSLRVTLGQAVFWTAFIAFCVAAGAALLVGYFGTYHQPTPQFRRGDAPTNDSATTLGSIGTLLAMLALFPVSRNGLLLFLFNLPFERAINYHRYIAYASILMLGIHGAMYIGFYANKDIFPDGIGSQMWDGVTGLNLSGLISWFAMAALFVTSLPFIRRHFFEFFYRTHIPFFLIFVVFAAIHEGAAIGFLAPALVLYALDIGLRIRSARAAIEMKSIKVLPGGVVRIEFDRTPKFRYDAGQYVFICLPTLSAFEWHPFSISTCPDDVDTVSIHVRVLGNWTAQVAKLADSIALRAGGAEGGPLPKLLVDGPYGEPTFPLENYKNFIMISGGIGITPLQSIYNDIINNWRRGARELRHVVFAWAVRESGSYSYLLDESTQKAHKLQSGLGVLPPFHTPMLLQEYTEQNHSLDNEPTNDNPIVSTEFYLTRGPVRPDGPSEMEMQDGRTVWVRPGRPDLDRIFKRLLERTGGEERTAVLVCGPAALVAAVKTACIRYSSPEHAFDLHVENFDL